MRRSWILAFLFLTLWQMLPHEGYNMLYAQDMGDESYGGGYNCEDDLGQYYSSLPCENTPCVTTCPGCGVTLACDALDDHICPADNITCSSCGRSLTPEQYHNHNCSNNPFGEENDGEWYNNPPEDTPPTTDPTPNNPPFQEEEDTGSSNSNNNTQEDDTEKGVFDDVEDSSSNPWSTENILERTGSRNNKMKAIIDSLSSWGRIKVDSLIENCQYNQEDSSIHVPADGGFGEESVIHEAIHYVQDENGMLDHDRCSADNEYQAYVLNFIFNRTYNKFEEITQPQGAKDTEKWNAFIKLIGTETNNNNGKFTYTNNFINALNSLDHKSLSSSFRSYYKALDDERESQGLKRKHENYYKNYDSNYNYNWEKMLNDLGFTKKE